MGDLAFSLLKKDEKVNPNEILGQYVPKIQKAAKERGLLQQNMIWDIPNMLAPDAEEVKRNLEQGTNVFLTFPDNAWFAKTAEDALKKMRG